jgi:hypothetical protein
MFYDLQQAHASPIADEALERIAALYAIAENRMDGYEFAALPRQSKVQVFLGSSGGLNAVMPAFGFAVGYVLRQTPRHRSSCG